MKVVSQESFIFNTDLGNMITEVREVEEYDVEDIVRDKAFSQGTILRFEQLAANADPNALKAVRSIKSKYSGG